MGTPPLWLQLSTVHCTLLGFCSGHFHQALGRQGLGPQPCFAEQNLKPGFLGLCPEKTEAAEVRHGSSSLAVHPQPGGPDAMVTRKQRGLCSCRSCGDKTKPAALGNYKTW